MDLWHGALAEFVRTAGGGSIAGAMAQGFVAAYGALPGSSEFSSWQASLAAVADALRPLARPDVGILVRGTPAHPSRPRAEAAADSESTTSYHPTSDATVGVAAEYQLPLSGRRLDVLLCG